MNVMFVLMLLLLLTGTVISVDPYPGIHIYGVDILASVLCVLGCIAVVRRIRRYGFLYVAKHIIYKKFILFGYLLIWIFVGAVSLIVSIPNVPVYEAIIGILYLLRFIVYSLGVIAGVLAIDKKTDDWLLLISLYGFCYACVGFLQMLAVPSFWPIFHFGWDPHVNRLSSTLLDPNFSGIIIGISIITTWVLYKRRIIQYPEGVLIFFVLFAALILTFSRSSWAALCIGFFPCLLFDKQDNRIRVFMRLLIIIILGMIVILTMPKGEGTNVFRTTSIVARMDNIYDAMYVISQSPILGSGFNLLGYVKQINDLLHSNESIIKSRAGFDNSFLFIIATTGIVGFGMFLLYISQIIRITKLLMNNKYTHYIGVGFCSIMLTVFVHSLFVNSLFFPWLMILFYIWVARVFFEARKL